jgi:ABC-type spermidine/putrescine transport system permease subunit II
MNGLDVAIVVIIFVIVVGVLIAVKVWRQSRSAQHLVPLTWSKIYHGAE